MTENKNKLSAGFGAFVLAALAVSAFAAPSSFAAENYFRSYAPSATPPLGLPPAIFGEVTRIPAARPPAAGQAYANYGDASAPQGRLRLRPANFSGL